MQHNVQRVALHRLKMCRDKISWHV